MDIVWIILILGGVAYLTRDNINKYKKGQYSSSIFSLRKKSDNQAGNTVRSKVIAILFCVSFLFINDHELRTRIYTYLLIYSFILMNIFNILYYIRKKRSSIIKDIIIFNVVLIVLYAAIVSVDFSHHLSLP